MTTSTESNTLVTDSDAFPSEEMNEILGSLSKDELDMFKRLLANPSGFDTLYETDYYEKPVDIDTFLESDRYIGKTTNHGTAIYPYWRNFMREYFNKGNQRPYEVALSGAIGVGKSTIAAYLMLYVLYCNVCLKEPREFYNLSGDAPITFAVLHLTLALAESGIYTMVVEAVKNSEFFMEHCTIRGKFSLGVEFDNSIQLITGSQPKSIIGKDLICAVMDEISFSQATVDGPNSVMKLYRSAKRRLESRFMRPGGFIPGMLVMISSKNNDSSFLEQYIDSNRDNPHAVIVDEPVYNIKPASKYCGERFTIAVGDKSKASFIIETAEDENRALEGNYRLEEVPVEYKDSFVRDMTESLKEICGISAFGSSKFIQYPGKIDVCIDKSRSNPMIYETIDMGLESQDSIIDYLDDIDMLKDRDPGKPRFIHLDIGLSGDALGMSIVHIAKEVEMDKTSIDGTLQTFIEPVYDVDLFLRMKAIPGSEIPLFRVREFILWIKKNIFNNIEMLSCDGFQSRDLLQIMTIAGFNTKYLSVDKTEDAYFNLRSTILDKRLIMPKHSILLNELRELERVRRTSGTYKIDHPEGGSKDVADGLAGAVQDALDYYTEHKEKYNKDKKVSNNMVALDAMKYFNRKERIRRENPGIEWLTEVSFRDPVIDEKFKGFEEIYYRNN